MCVGVGGNAKNNAGNVCEGEHSISATPQLVEDATEGMTSTYVGVVPEMLHNLKPYCATDTDGTVLDPNLAQYTYVHTCSSE